MNAATLTTIRDRCPDDSTFLARCDGGVYGQAARLAHLYAFRETQTEGFDPRAWQARTADRVIEIIRLTEPESSDLAAVERLPGAQAGMRELDDLSGVSRS